MNGVLRYLVDVACDRERGAGACLLRPFLLALSWLYGGGAAFRRGLYRRGLLGVFRAPVPVVSVGNIVAGGTGKTPFVRMLHGILCSQGFHPMVLTRGYMAGQGGVSDEAAMLEELIGPCVFTGADRVRSFQRAYASGQFDCVILDDGYQQWGFARDLDIVLLDSRRPFGNGALIPRGILRESRQALRRADIVVLTRAGGVPAVSLESLEAGIRALSPKAEIARGEHRLSGARDAFTGAALELPDIAGPAAAFCAIADPESFRSTLENSGVTPEMFTHFPDHYRFTTEDMEGFASGCRFRKLDRIFITHKDAGKVLPFRHCFSGIRVIIIDIELTITYGQTHIVSSLRRLRHS
jgi:tetraacyldisaccharide 4'-kinase